MTDAEQRQLELEEAMHSGGIERYFKTKESAQASGAESETQAGRRLLRDLVMPVGRSPGCLRNGQGGREDAGRHLVPGYLPPKCPRICRRRSWITWAERWHQDVAVQVGSALRIRCALPAWSLRPRRKKKVKERLSRQRASTMRHHRNVLISAEKRLAEGGSGYVFDVDRWQAWERQTSHGLV